MTSLFGIATHMFASRLRLGPFGTLVIWYMGIYHCFIRFFIGPMHLSLFTLISETLFFVACLFVIIAPYAIDVCESPKDGMLVWRLPIVLSL